MATFKELQQQQQELAAQMELVRQQEVKDAVAKIHAIMAEFDVTLADIGGGSVRSPRGLTKTTDKRSKVEVKWRDPVSGATWTGRGREPSWIQGKDREQFKV